VIGRPLARSRVAATAGAVALALAGCSTTGSTSSVTAKGQTLSIYLSAPAGAQSDPALQDVLDAERLAFAAHSATAEAHFHLRLALIDTGELSQHAREAISDNSSIAYLGELVPGSSEATAGITNAQDLLQVSPSDTALELTQTTPAIPKAPKRYYESLGTYGKTFARVVPTSAAEARADAAELGSLGVHSVYITGDGSDYSSAFSYVLRHSLPKTVTVASSSSSPGAVFYTGVSTSGAAAAFAAAVRANPKVVLFGSSPLALAPLPAGAAFPRLYVSQPGFLPSAETAAQRAFASSFRQAYGHAPATEAIFGYEAMSAVLRAIQLAGSHASDRATVVKDFFGLRLASSVLGAYTIDAGGDISIAPFVLDRLRSGRLVPFAALHP
jgi:branched-chain amino acid transport system substrate-binding protein